MYHTYPLPVPLCAVRHRPITLSKMRDPQNVARIQGWGLKCGERPGVRHRVIYLWRRTRADDVSAHPQITGDVASTALIFPQSPVNYRNKLVLRPPPLVMDAATRLYR